MLERLGIAQDLKRKIKLVGSQDAPENVFQGVAKGEIEMQVGQITEIAISSGVDFVGPLPDEIQNITWLAAGITTNSKAPKAAEALIRFISSPSAAALLKVNGFRT